MRRALVLAGLVALLAAPQAAAERTLVYLVRHAEKAEEPRRDPGLTSAGRERAAALAAVLVDTRLSGIVTSQFKRTRATAAPVVRASGLDPVTIPYRPGDFEAHGRAVAAAVRERFNGGIVLVVGHSDTVPAIVRALGGPEIERLCEPTEYASLFMLVVDGGGSASLARSRYGRPDPPLPPQCRAARR
ncbi:MAG: phosphoglycerate mutase family protein [Myxococcota bacterium]|nr:phosphoglycerate mutase family protein [Myxococcota bacterium]